MSDSQSVSPTALIEGAYATAKAVSQAAYATADAIAEAVRSSAMPTTPPQPIHPQLPIMTKFCQAREFFGRSLDTYLPPSAFAHFWLLDIDNPFYLFEVPSLNLAASYIRQYTCTKTKETHDWFHVMVRAVSFESFQMALDEDRGRTRTLAFSCWCDGGNEELRFRPHRHWIIVSPKNHFQAYVWHKVQEIPGIRCKAIKKIESPNHLMNALGYLSKRKARCEFMRKGIHQCPVKDNHFYIFKSLPVGFRMPLATQWDGGILELFYREHLQNISLNRLIENPLLYENSRCKKKNGELYDLERNIVLPVAKGFAPTEQITSNYVFTTRGRKLYFQFDSENERLSLDDWLQKQVKGGNSFYNAIQEDLWILRDLDRFMPYIEKMKELEKENINLKRQVNSLKEKNQ